MAPLALVALDSAGGGVSGIWGGGHYDAQFRAVREVSSTISAVGVVPTVSQSVG